MPDAMKPFRRVDASPAAGALVIHSMPGRYEAFETFLTAAREQKIDLMVALSPRAEIAEKSPDYGHALGRGEKRLPPVIEAAVPDFSVPAGDARQLFAATADRVVAALREGRRVLVHCGAGVGRSGTFACIVLRRLGVDPAECARRVGAAGAGPETPAQHALVTELGADAASETLPGRAE